MSHQLGIQAAHVNEMEVVTGRGDLLLCNKDINSDLFDCARAGLGQCGIITSVTIPLIKAPDVIRTCKLFYLASDTESFSRDVKAFVESGKIEMIHAFLKPCTEESIKSILGPNVFAASSSGFKNIIAEGELSNELVFFLELGCYRWNNESQETFNSDTINKILYPQKDSINGEYFFKEEDFESYITKDPPVIKTNKAHGTPVPHPSFATLIDEKHVVSLLKHHLTSSERGNDSTNEILIMPLMSNSKLHSGYDVPMFSMPKDSSLSFFLLFLGSAIPASPEIISKIRAHHRGLYALSTKLGGKRYNYDTITNEVKGEKAWRDHFGDETWERFVAVKRKYDPEHFLCPGVKMW